MSKSNPKSFSLPKLIITEGQDDECFIYFFLKFLSKDNKINRNLLEEIFIHRVNGKDKLLSGDYSEKKECGKKGLIDIIKDEEFIDNCTKVAVIFDADNKLKNSFESIIIDFTKINQQQELLDQYSRKKIFSLPTIQELGKVNQKNPTLANPCVSVFLIPNSENHGSLEDLYLSTLDEKDQKILECIKQKNIGECLIKNNPTHQKKLLVQSFITAKDQTLKSIGFAASSDKINFKSTALNPLKNFLINFANS